MAKELLLPLNDVLKSAIEEAVEVGGYTQEGISDSFRALATSINIASTLATAPSRHIRETLSFNIYDGLGKFSSTPCEETFEDIKTAGKIDEIDIPDEQLERIIKSHPRFIKRMSVKFGRYYRSQMRYGKNREAAREHHRRQTEEDMRKLGATRELALMRLRDGQAYPIPKDGIPPEFYANSMKILPKEKLTPA